MAFREDKAAALAAVLLEDAGGELEYLKLLKLMYLAERQSLLLLSDSITGDIFVSMRLGPVMSKTYDLIKGNWDDIDHDCWEASFAKHGYRLRLWERPQVEDILSPFEIGLAHTAWREFGDVDQWDLVGWIHATFPEWQATTSAIPIQRAEIFRALGLEDEEVCSRLRLEEAVTEFDSLVDKTLVSV